MIDNLDQYNILVSTSQNWNESIASYPPEVALPEALNGNGLPDGGHNDVEPVSMLVFDENTGDFIEASTDADLNSSNVALKPTTDTDTGSDETSDWAVYTASETDNTASDLADEELVSYTSVSIDWDAETGDINELIPPPSPGRSGMKHNSRATAL